MARRWSAHAEALVPAIRWRLRNDPAMPSAAWRCATSPPVLGPAAARFTPLSQNAVAQDERLLCSGGWRGIAEDDEARKLSQEALTAITP